MFVYYVDATVKDTLQQKMYIYFWYVINHLNNQSVAHSVNKNRYTDTAS